MAYGQSRIVSVVSNTEPVTLAEAKNYLRVTNDQDDAKITTQITAARAMAENYLNRDILPRNREQFVDRIPNGDKIELYGTPIDSDANITITIGGTATTEDSEWKKVGLEYDQQIEFQGSYVEDIKITYRTAGLVSDNTVKEGVKAILLSLYENDKAESWCFASLKPLKKYYF